MKNNNSYFNIINYIKSKLEKEQRIVCKAIVSIDVDSNDEPYIDINYIDEYGNQASMTNGLDNLIEIEDFADEFSDIFEIYQNDCVVSVIYDTGTEKLNLIKNRDGNYIGDKLWDDFEFPIFVGYIIKSENMSKTEKTLVLYDVVKSIMKNSCEYSIEEDVIFKVKDEPLNNIYYKRAFKKHSAGNYDETLLDKGNISVIENELQVKLSEEQIQKVKK